MHDESLIQDVPFNDMLSERYLAYALSTIMSRSLPDVRDGLKPVHRRLLYAMHQLKLNPDSRFKKCARVVGDVIGKFHPHGDVAVYDTLVRLAQDFTVRYPLIEGQGNFGSIDGDNAAAMRYTESRLTDVASALLQDIQHNTVPFRPTYDGETEEPAVLPASFPNLLANGSEGIAVGMATSIPPHNINELCDALVALLQTPSLTVASLVQRFVKGPDFPTGGVLMEPESNIISTYETGKGSFRVRAKWEKEALSHGLYQIVITEIPYHVQKSRLIERIATLFKEKKLVLLGNIRDESAEEMRIILEPKTRSCDPEMLMESLFKLTDLETRISLNLNVITSESVPKVLNLKEALVEFLDHREQVVINRTTHRLEHIAHRLEVLGGLLIAYLNLDEVIRIIREEDEPKQIMMERWNLTTIQADAILNIRLRSLRKLEELAIRQEHDALIEEQKTLQTILDDEKVRKKVIIGELKDIKKRFGKDPVLGPRRTDICHEAPSAQIVSLEALIEKEPITIFCSKMGWIRCIKGHTKEGGEENKYKEGDEARFTIDAYTTDKLIIFSKQGRCFTLSCDKIPKGKRYGDPLRLMIDMDQQDDVLTMFTSKAERILLVASSAGRGFRIEEEDVIGQTRSGKQVLNVPEGQEAAICMPVEGDTIAFVGKNRKLLIIPTEDVPLMKRGQGVILQRYKGGGLSDATSFMLEDGLSWKSGERTRTEKDLTPWIGKRGGAGRIPPVGFPRNNHF